MDYKAKAIELLGKKKEIPRYSNPYEYPITQHKKGHNQMHSKAVEVVVGLLEEGEERRLNDKESIAGLTKSCKEAIEELQSLKDKLTVKNIVRTIREIPLLCHDNIAQALIEELK